MMVRVVTAISISRRCAAAATGVDACGKLFVPPLTSFIRPNQERVVDLLCISERIALRHRVSESHELGLGFRFGPHAEQCNGTFESAY